ncbi:MAG: hypothetical protein J7L23_01640 [Candidatus Diapherotrites archaeon]|nr:hypothetical protein [Candidatus Diapherotrites archaeon]
MQAPIQTSQPAATVDSRAAALRLAVVLDYTVVVEPAKVHAHTVGMAAAMVVKPAEAARLTVDAVQTVTAAPLVVSVVPVIAKVVFAQVHALVMVKVALLTMTAVRGTVAVGHVASPSAVLGEVVHVVILRIVVAIFYVVVPSAARE